MRSAAGKCFIRVGCVSTRSCIRSSRTITVVTGTFRAASMLCSDMDMSRSYDSVKLSVSFSTTVTLSSSSSSPITVISDTRTCWERTAARVKNGAAGSIEEGGAPGGGADARVVAPYMGKIRAAHDPSLHLKTIEDELKSTIGEALGRQGAKIDYYRNLMETQYEQYESTLHHHKGDPTNPAVQAMAQQYNQYRTQAVQARWELIVHRQAAGFIVHNHQSVMHHYPIRDAIPIGGQNTNTAAAAATNTTTPGGNEKQPMFRDQLDWWERIGRWK